jgi:hypothetical protein
VNHTAFGVLALKAGGASSASIGSATSWLARQQAGDGGFGFAPGATGDVDDTGAALEALAVGGFGGSDRVTRAVKFLRRAQRGDGGFGQYADYSSNAQSTSWAVQGLVAVGRDPDAVKRNGRTPLGYIRSLARRDGSIRYSRSSSQTPVWVTAQALAALERRPFPLRAVKPKHPGKGAAAARAGARSASACRMPNTPIGASSTGAGIVVPSTVVDRSRCAGMPRSIRGSSRQWSNASRLARTVASVPAPAAM